MIQKITEDTALKFKNLSAEDKEKKGILGRLYGPVASFRSPTRNGRKYTQDLWEKLFESPLIKERFANGGIFGQLCHPDYEEVDMEKIACVMPEPPKKNENGDLVAYVDIINTPCGKIAYQLAKYGYKFGISSRGTGDLIPGIDGDEVDPDTYNLTAFDLVEVPAVESARLSFAESLDKTRYNKTLRQTLTEELESATKEDRAIMEDALDSLDIKLDTEESEEEEIPVEEEELTPEEIFENTLNNLEPEADSLYKYISDNEVDDDVVEKLYAIINKLSEALELLEPQEDEEVIDTEQDEEVVDDMSDEVTAELQEALLKIKSLEEDNLSLHEKLSVCNAKEIKQEEDIRKYKTAMVSLSESAKEAKDLNDRVRALTESLDKKEKLLASNKSRLNEMYENRRNSSKQLEEAVNEVSDLEGKLASVNEQLFEKSKLVEGYKSKLAKYQKALKESKDLFIKAKAESYGLTFEDVKQKLTESYTTKDVTSVCEKLSEQRRNLDSLPFKFNGRVAIREAKTSGDYISNDIVNTDDEITDTLLSLIN
jgi:hypothetical protein